MAHIGNPVKEVEIIPINVPVEEPAPVQPVETPERELEPA